MQATMAPYAACREVLVASEFAIPRFTRLNRRAAQYLTISGKRVSSVQGGFKQAT